MKISANFDRRNLSLKVDGKHCEGGGFNVIVTVHSKYSERKVDETRRIDEPQSSNDSHC